MMHGSADGVAFYQIRIQPRLKAVVVQYQRHPVVDVAGDAAGGLGDDGAAGGVFIQRRPDTAQEQRLAILPGEEVRLLAALPWHPLIPAVCGDQTAMLVEGTTEVARAVQPLGAGIDRCRATLTGPLRAVAPPEV